MVKKEDGEDLTPVALVTGSSRGLGKGIALELAKAGWSVAIHYSRNKDSALETADMCRSIAQNSKARFEIVRGDLASRTSRKDLVDATVASYGEIDALVNNAGMGPRTRADILDASEESFEELMATNLQGPYFLTQAFARRWLNPAAPASRIPQGRTIVFVTSISSETASIGRGEYCVSKAGLSMAVKLWATRLAGEAVQVYELRPGIMATDMTRGVKEKYDDLLQKGIVPQKRWGTPNDVGLAVRSLLSGDFPFSTGAAIDVDGGFHISRL